MSDINIKILAAATSFDLITLEELKIGLGIAATDTTQDAALNQLIYQCSDVISMQCNRVFARERVRETWRDSESRRLFLSHWPVQEDDIESVESPIGTILDPSVYELEERSGKLSIFNGAAASAVVTYTGGFDLPTDAPDALKQACVLHVRTQRTQQAREATTGIRSIVHKESRVMFFDPNAAGGTSSATMSGGSAEALKSLLYHYIRLEA